MDAGAGCATCGQLGAGEIANTGRDERLSPAWSRMTLLDLDSRIDLGVCPACGALFEWSDHPQYYGSGNLDEEHLRRLGPPEADLVRALLRTGEDPDAAQAAIAPALAGGVAEDLLIALLRRLVGQQRPAFQRLLPACSSTCSAARAAATAMCSGATCSPATIARASWSP